MITSMTGFGAAEGVVGTLRVVVEIRAVNHRFFNPSIKLPSAMSRWEADVREALRKRFSRGHVTLSAWIERDAEAAVAAGIDEERFGAYVSQLRQLRDRFSIAGDVDLSTIMRLPDVITSAMREEEIPGTVDELLAVVSMASDAMAETRRVEGARIADYLLERLALVEHALGRIAGRAPVRLEAQRHRMRESISELAGGIAIDPQRLAQEVAVLADRIDVSEELSRFAAHIAAFRGTVSAPSSDGVGKRLGFLLQEMLREANTTGSKANDAPMLADVMVIKEELERLREQVENVE
jgi:uncharacterized protein (TIGR00255 family)